MGDFVGDNVVASAIAVVTGAVVVTVASVISYCSSCICGDCSGGS